jgi:hypothetical protein
MLGRGYTVFAESWLHRRDGRFQLVTKTMTTGVTTETLAKDKTTVIPAKAKPQPKAPVKTTS